MNNRFQHMELIDLISERHFQVRKLLEDRWNHMSDIYLSNSEWFIMSRVYQEEETTISTITKQADISRQATHKFIKRLKEKGVVRIGDLENNKKEKSITLTDFGKECYEKGEALKAELKTKITNNIGAEQVKVLMELLRLDWGL